MSSFDFNKAWRGKAVDDSSEQASLEALSMRAEPRSTMLVVSSFYNLSSLAEFCRLVEKLPGVLNANPQKFVNGVLLLSVEHYSGADPADTLLNLFPSNLHLRAIGKGMVEIAIADDDSKLDTEVNTSSNPQRF
ncbi:MAG: hypothetical protein ACOX87_00545 [Chloroflexota bacterium]|jgi:hypothetical protein